MARDIVGAWIREIKKAEREAVSGQKAAEREHKALVRQAEKVLKEEERVQKQLLKARLHRGIFKERVLKACRHLWVVREVR